MKLRKVRAFHDEILLEHGYFIPREKYEEELGQVEQGMVVVTKTWPDQPSLRNNSRLVSHLETMRKTDRKAEHLNNNRPQLLSDGKINSVLYNLMNRESQNMSLLCSGAQIRHPAQVNINQNLLIFSSGDW